MSKQIKTWGENVWEDKIKEQGETGVIDGSIYSEKELLKRTVKERKFVESNFLGYVKPKAKVLDLGIGPIARFSVFFAKKGYKVTGVDISSTTLSHAGKNIEKAGVKINLVQDNLVTIKKIKGKFDMVFCWGTFGHIPAYLSLETLSSFNRVLDKKGYCIIDFWIEKEKTFKELLKNFSYWTGHLIKKAFRKTFPVNCSTYTHEEIKDMTKRTNFRIIKNIGGTYLLQKIK